MQKSLHRGVTFIELLIVIAIISIVMAYSITSFKSMTDRQNLKAAGNAIFSDLRLAQSEAIKRSETVYVNFKTQGKNWCYGMNVGDKCDCNKIDECKIDGIKKVTSSNKFNGVTMQRAKFAGNKQYTAFDPVTGFAKANGVKNGTIWLKSGAGTQLAIVVNRLGRIRFCSPTLTEFSKICPTPPKN